MRESTLEGREKKQKSHAPIYMHVYVCGGICCMNRDW